MSLSVTASVQIFRQWYAVYTRSRFEKKVFSELQKKDIECYLPLQKRLKQWSDRKKWVEEPLFRSYVFVKIAESEYFEVLKIDGVIRYVTFERKAVPIRESQITILKQILSTGIDLEVVEEHLQPGQAVEVIAGSLKGLKGYLVKYKGKQKVIVDIETIRHSIVLDINREFIKKTGNQKKSA